MRCLPRSCTLDYVLRNVISRDSMRRMNCGNLFSYNLLAALKYCILKYPPTNALTTLLTMFAQHRGDKRQHALNAWIADIAWVHE